jgi:flagellar protein FliO/FliZ
MLSRRILPTPTARTAATAALALVAALATGWPSCVQVRANEVPPTTATATAAPAAPRRPFPTRDDVASGTHRTPSHPGGTSSGGWWLGTTAAALALAACGWASVAARRYRPGSVAGAAGLRVVGRTSLSPRHTVYLLQAGDRVLIVGTGPQGAPSLLSELDADAMPPPPRPSDRAAAAGFDDDPPGPRRLDLRLGDDP